MLDPQNLVTISGGIVADPEVINDRILKIRLAVDYAGSEKDSDNNSGYFDIVYYLKDNNGFTSKNASFVAGQISDNKMKKGSGICVIGRLLHERWKQEDQTKSKVVIVAEHVSYGQRSNNSTSGSSSSSASKQDDAPKQSAPIPQSF